MRSLLKGVYYLILNKVFRYGIINKNNAGKINFIDIGAIGNLPSPWYKNANHIKKILRFEPQDEAVVDEHEITVDKVVWSTDEKRPFYIYKGNNSHGASLFEQNFEYVNENFEHLKNLGPKRLAETWHKRSELITTEEIDCRSLDNVLNDLDLPYTFDFCKVDAQGAEYDILMGATKYLREHCLGLHLELFNIPLYKGIKLLPEVEDYLKSFGFSLYKKMPFHGSFNSQNDCIFLKDEVPEDKKDIIALIKEIYK